MPFQSEKQRRYLHANHPEIAKRWERDYAGGGFIPAHEAGIYGLAEGGRTGFFTGMREQEQRQQERQTRGPRDDPDRHGPVQTVTPPRDDRPRNIHVDTPEILEEQRILDLKQMARDHEEEKGGLDYYGQKKTLVDQQNLENKTNEYILRNLQKLDPTKYYKDMNAFKKAWEIGKSIPKPTILGLLKAMYDEHKLTSEGKAILDEWKQYVGGPPGSNPEAYDALWLALEKRKPKYRYDDEGERDDDITTTIIAEDVSGYPSREEMMLAAQKAYEMLYGSDPETAPTEDRSKQMAYWQALMEPYMGMEQPSSLMVAKGGRVPQGYNTGGLSNLFRLKNK